jgi:hypothetical protein
MLAIMNIGKDRFQAMAIGMELRCVVFTQAAEDPH